MTRNRIWSVGLITAILAILGLTTVLGVLPQLRLASANNAERQSVEATNQVEAAKLASLTLDRRHASSLRTELTEADAALPAKPQLSSLLGELNTLEQRYHVKVTGYTGGDAQVFGGATAGGAATTATSTASTPAPSPSPSGAPSSTSGLLPGPVKSLLPTHPLAPVSSVVSSVLAPIKSILPTKLPIP